MMRLSCSVLPALALGLFGAVPFLSAQEAGDEPAPAEGEPAEASVEDEKDAKYFAIVGGDMYTGTGAVLRGATLLSRNGKITQIGYDVFVPEGAEILDAAGLRVYPGLVALGATSRLSAGNTLSEEPGAGPDRLEPENEILWDGLMPVPVHFPAGDDDRDHDHAPTGDLQAEEGGEEAKSDIEDTFDPFNPFLVLSLATGITTAQQSSAAVKLKRYEIDGVLIKDKNLANVTWDLRNPSGLQATREKFAKAAEYLRQMRAWRARNDKNEKEPSRKGVDTTANRVLSGEALAYFRASRREELLGIARFAQQYGFRPVIEGCEEGWVVADELGRAGAFAIVVPRARQPKEEHFTRAGGSSIENAAILHASGVQVAVRTDTTTIDFIGTAGRDLLALPVEAGFAVRGGLTEEAALAAVTIVPARILGADHRVGTLEMGKDCDAIVTDGDLLHYQTFVQYAVVDGKLVYDKEQEIYFAHIRPRPKKPAAAAPAKVEEPAEGAQAEESGAEEKPPSEDETPPDETPDETPDEVDDEKEKEDEQSGE